MTENLELELCLARIIDELRDQVDGHRRRNLILDSQLELLQKLTIRLEALTETYEGALKRMPEAAYLESQLTRLIEVALKGEAKTSDSALNQDIRKMFQP